MIEILNTGDPADLTLSPGDTLVLHTGDRVTSRGALAVTYDGTADSLTFDPAAIGNPTALTARRVKPAPDDQVTPGPVSPAVAHARAGTPTQQPHAIAGRPRPVPHANAGAPR